MPSVFTTSIHTQFATACCLFFLLTTVFLGVVKIEGSMDPVHFLQGWGSWTRVHVLYFPTNLKGGDEQVGSGSTFYKQIQFCCLQYHRSYNLSCNKFEFSVCDWLPWSSVTQQMKKKTLQTVKMSLNPKQTSNSKKLHNFPCTKTLKAIPFVPSRKKAKGLRELSQKYNLSLAI